jgi:prevent-host-death family protein
MTIAWMQRRNLLMRTMAAGEFKAKCLAVMDEVNSTGEPVLVTKRGKPVARILPSHERELKESPEAIFGSLRGMATLVGDPDEWIGPIVPGEEWDHLKPDWAPFSAE